MGLLVKSILMNQGPNVDVTIWTPAAGKRFQLLGWSFSSGNCTCTGNGYVRFKESGAFLSFAGSIGTSVAHHDPVGILPGDGIVSSGADNVLQCNLDGTVTAGYMAIAVWGNEL